MATISITTNLTQFSDESYLSGFLGDWEATGGGGAGLAQETDFFIEGTNSISKKVSNALKGIIFSGSVGGSQMGFNYYNLGGGVGSDFTINEHGYIWLFTTTPGLMATQEDGGLRCSMRRRFQTTVYTTWFVGGSDNPRSLQGGWRCFPIGAHGVAGFDFVSDGGSNDIVAPSGVGGDISTTGNVNGINFAVDRIRQGNVIFVSGGGSPDPDIQFSDIVDEAMLITNAWGIVYEVDGGAELIGRLDIGVDDTTTLTSMDTGNFTWFIPEHNQNGPNSQLTTGDFDGWYPANQNGATTGLCIKTRPNMSGLLFAGSQTTAVISNTTFENEDIWNHCIFDTNSATNTATVTFNNCTFTFTGEHDVTTGTTYNNCTFNETEALKANGASINNCKFNKCAPVIGSLNDIQGCNFTSIGNGDTGRYAYPVSSFVNFGGNKVEDLVRGGRTFWREDTGVAYGTNSQTNGNTFRVGANAIDARAVAPGNLNYFGFGQPYKYSELDPSSTTRVLLPATYEAWVYSDATLNNTELINIFGDTNDFANGVGSTLFIQGGSAGTARVLFHINTSSGGTQFIPFTPRSWNSNGHNHVAVCRDDSGFISAWINGVFCSTTASPTNNSVGEGWATIGQGNYNNQNNPQTQNGPHPFEIDMIRVTRSCVYEPGVNFTPVTTLDQYGPMPAIVCNDPAGTYTLDGCTFTGYGANGADSAAILFTATTGTINVNVSNGVIPTFTSRGATVNFNLSTTLTLTGIVPGSEVRVYQAGTTTEVGGVESTTTGNESFGISVTSVDIVIHALGYLHKRIKNVDTSTDRNIPIQQFIDRVYENP